MYWRRFATKDIPVDDKEKFEAWLKERWEEKDKLLEHFAQTGRFPANTNQPGATTRKPEHFETFVKPRSVLEIFGVMVPVAIAVSGAYVADRLVVAIFKHMLWKW
jgi:lysocardiolipin and lysophospholipid acyltransferase